MNKKYFKYSLTVVVLSLTLTAMALGQGPGDNNFGMLRAELERTDQLIEYARDAVRVASSVRAELYLENAVQLQEDAWDEFRIGTMERVGPLTREARELAKSSLIAARYTQQKQDVVLRKLERADELIQQVREQFRISTVDQTVAALMESAENSLRNAWEFYRNGEYRPALKLANQVENAIRRMVSVSNREAQGATEVERYSENVRDYVEEARHQIAECDSETAMKLMEEAQVSLDLARSLISEDRPQPAMEALKTAKKLATRARLDCSGFDGTLSERYERIKNEADQIAEMIPPGDENAQQLVDQVYEQLDLAAGYIAEGQTQQAAASLRAAQLTLNQLVETLDVSTE
ncbi:MAG: hypothetical protein JSV52_12835 [Candidatus Zixiibacteriota bacterium]|nr:MAG: hypothetical protein JSV52_12835 [candidate division Zixibacteria bacterium]